MRRWWLPLGLIWAQLMLSAFVFERRLPDAVTRAPSAVLLAVLFAVPAMAAGVLVYARRADRSLSLRSAAGDTLVLWLLTFFFAAHALVLAVAMGALSSLHPWLPLCVGGLLLGWAVILPGLPGASPFALTGGRQVTADVTRRVHHGVARGLALSGVLAFGSALLPSGVGLGLALVPALVAGAWGVLTVKGAVSVVREGAPDEEDEDSERPTGRSGRRAP